MLNGTMTAEQALLAAAGCAVRDAILDRMKDFVLAHPARDYPAECWITPALEALLQAFVDSGEMGRALPLRDIPDFLGMTIHWDAAEFRLA